MTKCTLTKKVKRFLAIASAGTTDESIPGAVPRRSDTFGVAVLPLLAFVAMFWATSASAQVRCFKDTRFGSPLMIDYGRSMVLWGDWISAEITETSVRWKTYTSLKTKSYYFDRNTFNLTEKNNFNEDVNARDYINEFSYRKVECQNNQKPRDLQ